MYICCMYQFDYICAFTYWSVALCWFLLLQDSVYMYIWLTSWPSHHKRPWNWRVASQDPHMLQLETFVSNENATSALLLRLEHGILSTYIYHHLPTFRFEATFQTFAELHVYRSVYKIYTYISCTIIWLSITSMSWLLISKTSVFICFHNGSVMFCGHSRRPVPYLELNSILLRSAKGVIPTV